MARTVLGVFDSVEAAERAADELQRRGFDRNEISIVAKESSARSGREGRGETTMRSDISGGVATGSAIGGAAGLLAGVGALAIPGIGPLVAAGPIAAALSGAVTGGIAGGLIDWGIPEESGRRYEQRVKEGKIVTAVRSDDDKVEDAADILRQNGAYDVETH
ncbi:MAG: hypothetical protein ACOX4B_01355 [Bacillota bacterium]|jgi:hypothetical protein|nr:hypothetical protein [Candidatus Fermentithermobacillaceae bacterium]